MVMAEAFDGCQYSVEVKSRFSLFLNEDLSNTDPDILLRESLKQRAERKKKAKTSHVENGLTEVKKTDALNEPKEQQNEVIATEPPCVPKISASLNQPLETQEEEHRNPKDAEASFPPPFRGRGAPRGFNRGFRGRYSATRPLAPDNSEPAGDMLPQNDICRPVGRARGRPRGIFSRGRGMQYTDYREQGRLNGPDHPSQRSPFRRDAYEQSDALGDCVTTDAVPENGDAEHIVAEQSVADQADSTANGELEVDVEEPKCYTLEEYKALRLANKPTITLASKEGRKPNDGKDVFANMVAHRKATDASEESTEEIETKHEEEQHFEINVSFMDRHLDRGRGRGFGGRGFERGRGFGPRGVGRPRGFRGDIRGRGFTRTAPPEGHAPPPVIYSDKDFPSLK
ncbi:unnamed protein product [Dicrocoelium dendriticum]|nr:unnamed protein product [Dicrocoelium dendriticum]